MEPVHSEAPCYLITCTDAHVSDDSRRHLPTWFRGFVQSQPSGWKNNESTSSLGSNQGKDRVSGLLSSAARFLQWKTNVLVTYSTSWIDYISDAKSPPCLVSGCIKAALMSPLRQHTKRWCHMSQIALHTQAFPAVFECDFTPTSINPIGLQQRPWS